MTAIVNLSVAALTIDCADPAALADFWGKALGRPVSPGAVPGDTAVDATDPASGPRMILHHVPGDRARADRAAEDRPPELRQGGGIGAVDVQGGETQADGGSRCVHDRFLPTGSFTDGLGHGVRGRLPSPSAVL